MRFLRFIVIVIGGAIAFPLAVMIHIWPVGVGVLAITLEWADDGFGRREFAQHFSIRERDSPALKLRTVSAQLAKDWRPCAEAKLEVMQKLADCQAWHDPDCKIENPRRAEERVPAACAVYEKGVRLAERYEYDVPHLTYGFRI